ncbi:hypothetical protein RRG08_025915 [Elysia crispata]|uniref:Uncharacterized protein n=1 Tax=Elysia crispata TaxID=231223 RepID=A0AAE1AGV7_9GAST|nr:hypothetical protein RRG08_025915 [Elysia crispata]
MMRYAESSRRESSSSGIDGACSAADVGFSLVHVIILISERYLPKLMRPVAQKVASVYNNHADEFMAVKPPSGHADAHSLTRQFIAGNLRWTLQPLE